MISNNKYYLLTGQPEVRAKNNLLLSPVFLLGERREEKIMAVRNLKRILAVLGTIALIGATTACAGSQPEVAGVKKTESVEKVRIGLVTTGAVRPALVVAANELGYYADEGLEVEFIPLDDSTQGWCTLVHSVPFFRNTQCIYT